MVKRVVSPVLLVVLVCATALAATPKHITVGHSALDGKRIKPFTGTWTLKQLHGEQWMDLGTITETVSKSRIDGRYVMVREQVTSIPMIEGEKTQTLVFDSKTLEPIRMDVSAAGKFPPPATEKSHVEYGGKKVSGEITSFDGEAKSVDQQNETPMFESAMLGLVIAALPLRDDYVAELPVNFVMQGTQWVVRAKVTGTKTYEFNGKPVDTWVVRTDWRDITTDDGYPDDDSGGTFYVTSNPPKGFPYVARYVNPNVDIDVKLD